MKVPEQKLLVRAPVTLGKHKAATALRQALIRLV